MGADQKKVGDLLNASLENSTSVILRFSPKMSYPPKEWAVADAFWAPKAVQADAKVNAVRRRRSSRFSGGTLGCFRSLPPTVTSMLEWLTIPVLLAAFLGWFVFSARKDKVRRDQDLAVFGQRHGLKPETFTVDVFGPRAVTYGPLWPDLEDFRLGRGRVTIQNAWRGPWNGGEVRVFEFDRNSAALGRAILFESPALDLPSFVVLPHADHPEAFGESITLDGIVVLTRDTGAVRRLLTPEVVAFLAERQDGRRTWVEGRGRRLLYYKETAAPRRMSRPRPDLAADAGDEGFWQGGETLARLLGATAG